jgi:hypothetical protein
MKPQGSNIVTFSSCTFATRLHIGTTAPILRRDETTIRARGEAGLNSSPNALNQRRYLRCIENCSDACNIRTAARSGGRLCQHGADHSRSFVYWEARHQLLRKVRTIFFQRSGR